MSFDVLLRTSNLSSRTVEAVNPFTGEKIQRHFGETLTGGERVALKRLLDSATPAGSDDDGRYDVRLSDGSFADVIFGPLGGDEDCSGGTIALRGLTTEMARFIHSLAVAGNLFIIPVMEPPATIVVSQDTAARVASRWPDVTVAESPDELYSLLSKGVAAWAKFRDQCIARCTEETK